jgi:hypothetical protein
MSSPIHLTDAQMSALLAASYPLHANQRNQFLETCARELARLGDIGDGDVHRVVMAVQKRFFDPPPIHDLSRPVFWIGTFARNAYAIGITCASAPPKPELF